MEHKQLARLPVQEGARLVARTYLTQARAARARLAERKDRDALHDFRVALRRLRSVLSAFELEVEDTVSKKLRRRLKSLAKATGPARDAEVLETLARDLASELKGTPGEIANALLPPFERRTRAAGRRVRAEVGPRFDKIAPALAERLSYYQLSIEAPAVASTLGEATGKQVRTLGKELARCLLAIHSLASEEEAHDARIFAKRIRYLLEPFGKEQPRCVEVIAALKELQEILGDLNDTAIFLVALSKTKLEREAEPLARAVISRRKKLFDRLVSQWLGGRAEPFLDRLSDLSTRFATVGNALQSLSRKPGMASVTLADARPSPVAVRVAHARS